MQNVKVKDIIRIDRMDDADGKDTHASKYKGVTGTITHIDDAGQLHGTWGGLAVLPEVDEFTVIGHDDTEPLYSR